MSLIDNIKMKRIAGICVLAMMVAGLVGLKGSAAQIENLCGDYVSFNVLNLVSYVTKSSESTSSKVSKTISVSRPITKIVNNLSADVVCTPGKSNIKISGPSEEVDKLEIKQMGGEISINLRNGVTRANLSNVSIQVFAENLESVNSKGSGDIIAKELKGTSCEMRSQGSGDIRVDNVEATTFYMVSMGSGDLTVGKVSATTCKIQSQGSGDLTVGGAQSTLFRTYSQGSGEIGIKKVVSTQIEILSQGSGDIDVSQIEATRVKAISQGSGDIKLKGTATSVNVIKQGTGTVNTDGLKTQRTTIQ